MSEGQWKPQLDGHRIPPLRKTIWAKEIVDWNLASVAFGHLYDGVKLSQDRPSIAMFAPEPVCKWRGASFFVTRIWGILSCGSEPIIFPHPYFQQLFRYIVENICQKIYFKYQVSKRNSVYQTHKPVCTAILSYCIELHFELKVKGTLWVPTFSLTFGSSFTSSVAV